MRGLTECIYLGSTIVYQKLISLFTIITLRLRSVEIDGSVLFYGRFDLVMGSTRSIHIARSCVFESDVRLKTFGLGSISIGPQVSLNERVLICAGDSVTIGKDSVVGPDVHINDTNHTYSSPHISIRDQGWTAKPIVIDEDVWIGAGCIILDGVHIGKGSIIGAGSIVTKSIPPMSVAVGNPAKVIKSRI